MIDFRPTRRSFRRAAYLAGNLLCITSGLSAVDLADTTDPVELAEKLRVEMIERVLPAAVCVYDANKRGGGSGVLIDQDGYGVTNYHVIAKMLRERRAWGALGDGQFYEMEVLGIDPTGDLAMFRLIGEQRFPSVPLGDSHAVRVGAPVVVLGDPFVLSEDNMPTVTSGIITGVHRYQGGSKGNLIYSDCLQTDASINPGNSGGPLINAEGEVIGITGRISVGQRGRFNVGHGYAISSNQVRRFVPALRAGLLARHGTLEATVRERSDGPIEFDKMASNSPAKIAGLRPGDRLVSINGVLITSVNQYVSIMGTYPEDWPVTVVVQRGSQRIEKIIRLGPLEPNIKFEYVADQQVNARQVQRVLQRFREASGASPEGASPAQWVAWTILMRGDGVPAPEGGQPPRLRFVHVPQEPALLVRDGGSDARKFIRFDELWAERPDGTLLLPEWQMAYTALYYLQSLLVGGSEASDLDPVEFAGADAPILSSRSPPAPRGRPAVWDVLAWQTPGGLTIKISFDPLTGFARRVRAYDPASNRRTSIELEDHQRFGRITWPRLLDVNGPNVYFEIEVLEVECRP